MTSNDHSSICFLPATELADRIRRGVFSCREVMTAHLDQIDRVNPYLNAIHNLISRDRALELSDAADRQLVKGGPSGPLHGLPMAIKDLADVEGMITSKGSPLYKDHVANQDSLFVHRIRNAGAILIGKTNTPEFGAGSHTFNTIYGVTRNPYDQQRSAGGSSGGAGAALASGMLPLADGSDMGGSLRNPAAFNGVCALRPSVGRVPRNVPNTGWMMRHSVEGPMARHVTDVALLLSVMAGHDPIDPLSIHDSNEQFLKPLAMDCRDLRLAWGGNLDCMAVDPAVMSVCEKSLETFSDMGCRIEYTHPDLSDAMQAFQVQRAMGMSQLAGLLAGITPDWRSQVKDTLLWNIDLGARLTAEEIIASDVTRAAIYRRMNLFFEHRDFLLLPTTQVTPFDVEEEWVREIDGHPMATYIDWMRSCCIITMTGLPAASVPCGFTDQGLPVGLQIVGKPWGEFAVLQLAHAFEQALNLQGPEPFGRAMGK